MFFAFIVSNGRLKTWVNTENPQYIKSVKSIESIAEVLSRAES